MLAYDGRIHNLKDLKDLKGVSFHRIIPPFGVVEPCRRLISLAGVKWSCLRINEHAFAARALRRRRNKNLHTAKTRVLRVETSPGAQG